MLAPLLLAEGEQMSDFATTVEERDFYKEQYERVLKERDRWVELSRRQDVMLTVYRSGNYHRAAAVADLMEKARERVRNGE